MKSLRLMMMALSALVIFSCGEDESSKDVSVELEMVVGDESLTHGTTYNINGTDVQFTNVAWYLGDMTFETSDNVSFTSQDRYQIIKPGTYNFDFSIPYEKDGPDVSLDKISFIIGVDAETNAETEMDFTMRPEGDALGQQNPTMHWGWLGGYRFINIDGEADLDGDGEFETPLTFHLGNDEFLGNVSLTPNEKLESGANNFQLKFDFAEYLGNLDFSTENFTKVQPDNITLASKLLNNYSSSFTFEK